MKTAVSAECCGHLPMAPLRPGPKKDIKHKIKVMYVSSQAWENMWELFTGFLCVGKHCMGDECLGETRRKARARVTNICDSVMHRPSV